MMAELGDSGLVGGVGFTEDVGDLLVIDALGEKVGGVGAVERTFSGGVVDGVGDGGEGLVAGEVDVGVNEVGQLAAGAAHVGEGESGLEGEGWIERRSNDRTQAAMRTAARS